MMNLIVMQNLVGTITNVHLRFEDIPTVGGEGEGEAAVRGVGGVPLLRPVAVGFVLRELCIAATDDGGAPVFFADHSDQHKELRFVFKMMNFAFKMMNLVLKMMNLVLKLMNLVLKMMNRVLKMMNLEKQSFKALRARHLFREPAAGRPAQREAGGNRPD